MTAPQPLSVTAAAAVTFVRMDHDDPALLE